MQQPGGEKYARILIVETNGKNGSSVRHVVQDRALLEVSASPYDINRPCIGPAGTSHDLGLEMQLGVSTACERAKDVTRT